jgi:hypothetical protein
LRAKRVVFAYLGLVLMSGLRVGAAEGLVVCIQADGRVAIESSINGSSCASVCLCDQGQSADPCAVCFDFLPSACDCIDIPLLIGIDEHFGVSARVVATAPVFVELGLADANWQLIASGTEPLDLRAMTPFPDTRRLSLQSVILLI